MKSAITKNISIYILLFLIACSCGEKQSNHQVEKSTQSQTSVVSQSSNYLYITDQNNAQVAEIAIAPNGSVVLTTAEGKYFGEPKGVKLKFYNDNDQFVAEIKYGDSGFKVRDANSELRWKVKTYENKIKIADN